jgi:hypothetical protein
MYSILDRATTNIYSKFNSSISKTTLLEKDLNAEDDNDGASIAKSEVEEDEETENTKGEEVVDTGRSCF